MAIEKRIEKEFYARPSVEVAQNIIGKGIIRHLDGRTVRGIVTEVAAWEGETDNKYHGLRYAPGFIGISKRFGKYVMLIGTEAEDIPSCITFIGAMVTDKKSPRHVQGAGNFTDLFHIDDTFDSVPIYRNDRLYIVSGSPAIQTILKRDKTAVPDNCRGYFYLKK